MHTPGTLQRKQDYPTGNNQSRRQVGEFVLDRGVNKREAFSDLDGAGVKFVVRLDPKARHIVTTENKIEVKAHNNLKILGDSQVMLFSKKGKKIGPYRLIRTLKDDGSGEHVCFLTNCNDLGILEIIDAYKKGGISKYFSGSSNKN